jgi:hypothetical protein
MSNENNRRGHREALPYFLGGLILLIIGCGAETVISLATPLVKILAHSAIFLGGYYTLIDGSLYLAV